MHELSIIVSILEIAEEKAKNLNAKIVHEIEIDIGELSGVDFDAMEFAMEHSQKPEMMQNVKFVINKIPARAKCNNCEHEFKISDYYTACPKCNNFNHDIFQGKELKVKSIKID